LVPSRNNRAVGVEYVSEGNGIPSHPPIVVKASRLVVLSAGAFGSPNILERSGVGSKEVLEKNGIPQIADLPGVGEHYMGFHHYLFQGSRTNVFVDHLVFFLNFYGSEETESLDSLTRGEEADGS
jgi:alcohol oxidase